MVYKHINYNDIINYDDINDILKLLRGEYPLIISQYDCGEPLPTATDRVLSEYIYKNSNKNVFQVVICKGGILPPNTYYDCGSFVVNRKAVIRKEKKSLVTAANSTQNGVVANNRKLKPALLTI